MKEFFEKNRWAAFLGLLLTHGIVVQRTCHSRYRWIETFAIRIAHHFLQDDRHFLLVDHVVAADEHFRLVSALGGDLGVSYSYNVPVKELLHGRIGVTAALSLLAFVMVVLISIPLGLRLAEKAGKTVDRIMTVIGQIMMAIPPFFIGIIFTSVFGLALRLFVAGKFVSISESFWGFWGYLFFPALAIALPKSAMTVKLLRSSILSELDEDYVRTAYSRGHSRKSALRYHVLRNSLMPVITFLAVTLADIVAGSIIIEQVFLIPGIGRLLLLAISNRDFPVVLAIVMIIAALVIFVNFLAEIFHIGYILIG